MPLTELIVRRYTREAGVRNLEREIAKLARKAVKEILRAATEDPGSRSPSRKSWRSFLGVPKYRYGQMPSMEDQIGIVTGLAWTEVGGELV